MTAAGLERSSAHRMVRGRRTRRDGGRVSGCRDPERTPASLGRGGHPVLPTAAVPRICTRASTQGRGAPPKSASPRVNAKNREHGDGSSERGRSPRAQTDPRLQEAGDGDRGDRDGTASARGFGSREPGATLPCSRRPGPDVPAGLWGLPLLTSARGPVPTVAGDDREVWASECLALSMPPWMR